MTDGHRYGVDHGVTFHVENKLRTVLWGWMGEPLTTAELEAVEGVRDDATGDLGERLADLVTPREVAALVGRCERLLRRRTMPDPGGAWPVIPWPPF